MGIITLLLMWVPAFLFIILVFPNRFSSEFSMRDREQSWRKRSRTHREEKAKNYAEKQAQLDLQIKEMLITTNKMSDDIGKLSRKNL